MFSLAFRSVLVLGILFGLLFAVLAGVLSYYEVSLWLAVGATLLIAGLQYWISPYILEWIFRIRWVEPEQANRNMARFLRTACQEQKIPLPRFGIIEDGNPNAFTFGHYPGDARLVLTRGLLDVCDQDEVEAVVAHELGHIVHWDFVVMTIAATIPLALYMIWRFGLGGRRSRDGGGWVVLVAIGAFLAYLVSEFLVLFLSRVREYYADEYSGQTTNNPRALATALVKIAYGLARQPKEKQREKESVRLQAATAGGSRMLGIFDPGFGAPLALAAAGSYRDPARASDPHVIGQALEWDLFNPWAALVELRSSHPLPAKRIRHLEKLAAQRGQTLPFGLPERPRESYWDDFAGDLLVMFLPLLGLIVGGIGALTLGWWTAMPVAAAGLTLLGLGLGLLIKIVSIYPRGEFPPRTVAELISNVKVSQVRCVPARLEGEVIGRGIPGLYWSEDLVVADHTGFMILDYRQPLQILEFLFGLFRAEGFIGQRVEAQGWYRRFPRPYLELWRVRLPNGQIHTSHNRAVALWGSVLLVVVGAIGLAAGALLMV